MRRKSVALAFACATSSVFAFAAPAAGDTVRVSLMSDGTEATGTSQTGSMSSDGRYVAFLAAGGLVASDTNGQNDAYLRDVQAGTVERVSEATGGGNGNGSAAITIRAISSDGRYVVFNSDSTNLVAGDTNGVGDIFLRDTQADTTTRVSVTSAGAQSNGHSGYAAISGDGEVVAFRSLATNLVAGDGNAVADMFARDTQAATTTRVSVDTLGGDANAETYDGGPPGISSDGRYITFDTSASDIVAGDANGTLDVFVRDTQGATTSRVSVDSGGGDGNGGSFNGALSADGRYAGFASTSTDLVTGDVNATNDVFVRDTQGATTTRVSLASNGTEGNGASGGSGVSLSSDGRIVAFGSSATNLVAGDGNSSADIFTRDTQAATTVRASVATDGTQANAGSEFAAVAPGGGFVTFHSDATNLVAGDGNASTDVFRFARASSQSGGGGSSENRPRPAPAPPALSQPPSTAPAVADSLTLVGRPAAVQLGPMTLDFGPGSRGGGGRSHAVDRNPTIAIGEVDCDPDEGVTACELVLRPRLFVGRQARGRARAAWARAWRLAPLTLRLAPGEKRKLEVSLSRAGFRAFRKRGRGRVGFRMAASNDLVAPSHGIRSVLLLRPRR